MLLTCMSVYTSMTVTIDAPDMCEYVYTSMTVTIDAPDMCEYDYTVTLSP